MRLIVTIPAKDESENIAEVIREIPRTIPGVSSVSVLVVDDGSGDGTADVAMRAGADRVVRNKRNMGLAYSFQRALGEALGMGADVIVNTDGDNHYDQAAIPRLVAPVVAGEADIVIGSRVLDDVDMPMANRYGNRLANAVMQRLLALPGVDVSTGFRAYSREAALRLVVMSRHTYTHESLLSAIDQQLVIANLPIPARTVSRPSRLISSVPRHIYRAGTTILRSFLLYRPLAVFLLVGALLVGASGLLGLRFAGHWLAGDGSGHVQSLLLALGLLYTGGQVILLGLLADALRANRVVAQEVLRNTRLMVAGEHRTALRARANAARANGASANGAPVAGEAIAEAAIALSARNLRAPRP